MLMIAFSDLLLELVAIAETLTEGEGQLARAAHKLSFLYEQRNMPSEAAAYKARALDLKAKLRPEAKNAPFTEEEFGKLCLWMLW